MIRMKDDKQYMKKGMAVLYTFLMEGFYRTEQETPKLAYMLK